MATKQQFLHLYGGLLGIAPGAVSVDFRWKIGFEDRLQHQHRCCHADPIPHGRDAQRPEFAVGLRYVHASDRLWSVCLLPERKRQFGQPPLDPIRLDVRKVLPVHARRALVRAALGIGMHQNILAADLMGWTPPASRRRYVANHRRGTWNSNYWRSISASERFTFTASTPTGSSYRARSAGRSWPKWSATWHRRQSRWRRVRARIIGVDAGSPPAAKCVSSILVS